MCYLNVQAIITIEIFYWLFIANEKLRGFFLYSFMVTQFEYEKVIDLGFWETPYIIILPE
jgi:hypothetical protein